MRRDRISGFAAGQEQGARAACRNRLAGTVSLGRNSEQNALPGALSFFPSTPVRRVFKLRGASAFRAMAVLEASARSLLPSLD